MFQHLSEVDHPPFFGDIHVAGRLQALARGPSPLISIDTVDGKPAHWRLALTASGRNVLARDADWIKLNGGIDAWLGGVHLLGADSPWRWDQAAGKLVALAA